MQNENTKQTLEGEKEKEIETEFFIQMTMQIQIQHKYITQIINKTKNKKK